MLACGSGNGSDADADTTAADTIQEVEYATIKGQGVNVRCGPGIEHLVAFKLNQGDEVVVLGSQYSTDADEGPVELILTAPLKVRVGNQEYTLSAGMAVTSIAAGDEGEDLLIITFTLEGKTMADSAVYIEDIRAKRVSETPWYNIRTPDEREGWVYGDFVVE